MTLSNIVWAQQVSAATSLPDQRMKSRLASIIADAMDSPSSSIPQATQGNAGQAKATYRFYANDRVNGSSLNHGFGLETARRCLDQDSVLVVQDTTTLNLTGLHSIAELGPIDSGNLARGLHLHSAIGLTLQAKVIGILDQQCWVRPQPQPKQSKKKQTQDKESSKWINGLENARAVLYEAAGGLAVPRLIHLMDREGDAYEVMMAVEDCGDSAIIRSAQNRLIDNPLAKAHDAVRNQPVLGQVSIEVKRKKDIAQREALVQVRSMAATLEPNLQQYPHAWSMKWNLVEVWEPESPAAVEPLHWLLWTREPATTADEALEVVRKYTCRWPIEEIHLVLKSGCKVEDLRLQSWGRLEKALRVNASVAARIVMLRDLARETPQTPALQVLAKDEVDALVSRFGKGKAIPAADLSIAQAVLWIGRLGGHLNRRSDGMPGVRTMWRGLQALALLVAGFRAGLRAGHLMLE